MQELDDIVTNFAQKLIDAKEQYFEALLSEPTIHYMFETNQVAFEEGDLSLKVGGVTDYSDGVQVHVLQFSQEIRIRTSPYSAE